MTEQKLPTRWKRFWEPDHDSWTAPPFTVIAVVMLVNGLIQAVYGYWFTALTLSAVALLCWVAARACRLSYRMGYWRAVLDFHQSVDAAHRDGIAVDSDEFWERESIKAKLLIMQWRLGDHHLPWRRMR